HPGARRQRGPPRRLHARVPFAAPPGRWGAQPLLGPPRAEDLLRVRHVPEQAAHAVRVDEPVLGRILRPLHPDALDGRLDGLEDLLMADVTTVEHDVLVIGAGGAGLRAAIEAAAQNVSVGLVCKSLLGKAHTVMAEGGIAASLA